MSKESTVLRRVLLECPDLPVNPVLDDQFHLVFTHARLAADTDLHFQQVEDGLDGGKIGFGSR